jgi:hypothetical protein
VTVQQRTRLISRQVFRSNALLLVHIRKDSGIPYIIMSTGNIRQGQGGDEKTHNRCLQRHCIMSRVTIFVNLTRSLLQHRSTCGISLPYLGLSGAPSRAPVIQFFNNIKWFQSMGYDDIFLLSWLCRTAGSILFRSSSPMSPKCNLKRPPDGRFC